MEGPCQYGIDAREHEKKDMHTRRSSHRTRRISSHWSSLKGRRGGSTSAEALLQTSTADVMVQEECGIGGGPRKLCRKLVRRVTRPSSESRSRSAIACCLRPGILSRGLRGVILLARRDVADIGEPGRAPQIWRAQGVDHQHVALACNLVDIFPRTRGRTTGFATGASFSGPLAEGWHFSDADSPSFFE